MPCGLFHFVYAFFIILYRRITPRSFDISDRVFAGGYMEELDVMSKLSNVFGSLMQPNKDVAYIEKINKHKQWLATIRHEHPSPHKKYKIGVYIRYFNQTKYDDYLKYHIQQFSDTIALCPNWTLVGFYVDEGSVAPRMETAPEWCRLLGDCFDGKVDLIITQKVSNVSRTPDEIAFLARILAAQKHPIGIYFVSEDLFTLASYYQEDLRDTEFLLDKETGKLLVENEEPDIE